MSDAMYVADPLCASLLTFCRPGPDIPPSPDLHVVATYYPPGSTSVMAVVCDTPVTPAVPPVAAIRAEAARRAPQLHAATGGSEYLINAAVVFYLTAPTSSSAGGDPTAVTIAPFTLAGHRFTIRLQLTATDWTWGDGTTTRYTSNPAGQPYHPDLPCVSLTDCPDYIAHTYRQPGTHTATASAHWSASYTLDTNPDPVPIPGELTTTSTPRTITLHQAHAELVAQ